MLESHSHSRVLALSPGFAGVLSAVGELGEAFLVVRNEACLMGGLARSLRYAQVGHRRLAWADGLNLNISSRYRPVVLAYSETGAEGEIEGIEFFDPCGRGCMKICRTAEIDLEAWNDLVADLTCGVVARETLSSLRKTNHLNRSFCCEACRQKQQQRIASQPPVARVREELRRFIVEAIDEERRLDVTLPCGLLRTQATLEPRELNWQGQWAYVSSESSGCHLRVSEGSSLTVSDKSAGIRTMNLFDDRGQFAVRLTSRPNNLTYL